MGGSKPFYKKLWFWLIVFLAICIYSSVNKLAEDAKFEANFEKSRNAHVASMVEKSAVTSVTEQPTENLAEIEENFKNSCETIDYKTLARNPDKYKGNNYKITGEVIQVQEFRRNSTVELRINITKETYGYNDKAYYTDTVYCTVEIPDGEDRILEDDIITFWGTCDGLYSYESVVGSLISLPKIDIQYFEMAE